MNEASEQMCNSLSSLVCGEARVDETSGDYEKMTEEIRAQVNDYFGFSLNFHDVINEKRTSYFMPLVLRSLMEVSCSGLLARVDPFRVIYAAKSQLGYYDKGRQQLASLKWSGDILDDTKAKVPATAEGDKSVVNGGKKKASWNPALSRKDFPRALFSPCMSEILWEPAHLSFTDWLASNGAETSVWLSNMAAMSSEDVCEIYSTEGNKIYSELSKGIHPEFIIQREAEFDAVTLSSLFDRAISWVCTVSALTHFTSMPNGCIDKQKVISFLLHVEKAACK